MSGELVCKETIPICPMMTEYRAVQVLRESKHIELPERQSPKWPRNLSKLDGPWIVESESGSGAFLGKKTLAELIQDGNHIL